MSSNLNLFTRLNEEGGCSQVNKVAFQTMNFTPKTSKEIVDNMKRLEAIAQNPDDNSIEYGKVFYLPCILTEAQPATAEQARIGGVMQADGSVATTTAPEVEEASDEPDF